MVLSWSMELRWMHPHHIVTNLLYNFKGTSSCRHELVLSTKWKPYRIAQLKLSLLAMFISFVLVGSNLLVGLFNVGSNLLVELLHWFNSFFCIKAHLIVRRNGIKSMVARGLSPYTTSNGDRSEIQLGDLLWTNSACASFKSQSFNDFLTIPRRRVVRVLRFVNSVWPSVWGWQPMLN